MAFTDEDKAWISSTMVGLLAPINTRLDAIDTRLSGIDTRLDRMDVRFDAIDTRLNGIDIRLDAIDTRLNGIDIRLDAIDTRLDGMDVRFDAIDTRLDRMDIRFDAIDDRLIATNDKLDTSSARLTDYMLEMRTEVIRRFDALDQRLDFMSTTLLNVQPLTKGMLDLGSLMGQLTRAQQHSTDRHFDLETRILRLEDQMSKLINRAA
jgi:archaellum component FlaC